jgi:hypothetical protein
MRGPLSWAFAVLAVAGTASGQPSKDPDIAYLYPAGGRQGESLEITVGGQQLAQITEAWISGEGVRTSVVGYSRPLPRKRFQEFRETLAAHKKDTMEMGPKKATQSKDERIGAILQEAGASEEEIRLFKVMQHQRNDPKRQDNKQLEEMVTLRLEIGPDAPPGRRLVRLLGKNGISNPLIFSVGTYPEVREPSATEASPPAPEPLVFPVVINGQSLPGETDRYAFSAASGERLVFIGRARALVPYLADAVPGWFQLVLTVLDAAGNKVAEAQSFRYSPDPVLVFDVIETGTYQLEVRDSLHRGREDFVYRITAGQIPFSAGIAPLGAPCRTQADVEVFGWNLPRNRASVVVPEEPGIYSSLFEDAPWILFEAGGGAEVMSSEPDDDLEQAGLVPTPSTINGRIDKAGDVDVFAVRSSRGAPLVVEVFARRLGSPLDSFLRITDENGHEIMRGDDQEDAGTGLLTHHADTRLLFDPPADGLYRISIGDAQNAGGPDFPYRLRIGPPRPDFELRATPSGISGHPEANVPVTIHALHRDGFRGEILLDCATPGFVLSGGVIPSGADSVTATLQFPAKPEKPLQDVLITGSADIGGNKMVHAAVAADDMLQAFFHHHLVPTGKLFAFIPADAKPRPSLSVSPASIKFIDGNPVSLRATAPKHLLDGLKATLVNAPDGITVAGVKPAERGIEIALAADPGKIKSAEGNLIIELTANRPRKLDPSKMDTWSVGYLPAIPFKVESTVARRP